MRNFDSDELENALKFIKKNMCGRIFIGSYQERRYVERLNEYRDVIVVNNLELGFIKDLETLKELLHKSTLGSAWIGITGPNIVGAPVGNGLWVKLKDIVPGQYWFLVKTVKFKDDEISFSIKCLRSIQSGACSLSKEQLPTDSENIENIFSEWNISLMNILETVYGNIASICTLANFKNSTQYILIFLVTIIIGIIKLTRELGDFSLKLLREFSIFLHVTTPIYLQVIEFFTKCVGGFYLLILALWRSRGNMQPRPHPPNVRYRPIAYRN